jgi:hypothetical protein
MLRLACAALVAAVVLVACGGDTPPAATPPPGAEQTPGAEPTPPGPPPDGSLEYLTTEDIAAAFAALEAKASWTFDTTFYLEGYETETTLRGTERRAPLAAIDVMHRWEDSDAHYVRIDDDVWVSLGDGRYTHALASESPNLIVQYEPLHLAELISRTNGWQRNVQYDLVGQETINGVRALHYTLDEIDREFMIDRVKIEPEEWGGDFWIAADGGYLVRFVWGPQSLETASVAPYGVIYDVTAVGCDCPVDSPE